MHRCLRCRQLNPCRPVKRPGRRPRRRPLPWRRPPLVAKMAASVEERLPRPPAAPGITASPNALERAPPKAPAAPLAASPPSPSAPLAVAPATVLFVAPNAGSPGPEGGARPPGPALAPHLAAPGPQPQPAGDPAPRGRGPGARRSLRRFIRGSAAPCPAPGMAAPARRRHAGPRLAACAALARTRPDGRDPRSLATAWSGWFGMGRERAARRNLWRCDPAGRQPAPGKPAADPGRHHHPRCRQRPGGPRDGADRRRTRQAAGGAGRP